LEAFYAGSIAVGFKKAFKGITKVVRQLKASQAATATGEELEPDAPVATAALRAGLTIDLSGLQTLFEQMYGSAYTLGSHVAADAVTDTSGAVGRVMPFLSDVDSSINWDAWQPGDGAAAAKVADGGLANLLNNTGIEIQSIAQDRVNELGNVLAKGIANGDSTTTISGSLVDVLDNPSRADMVARTEVDRAMTAASLNTYSENGVQQVEWMTADGCDACEELADSGPYDPDDYPDIPHPSCRCSPSPLPNDTSNDATDSTTDADQAAIPEDTDGSLTQAVEPDTTKSTPITRAGILIVAQDTGRVLLEQRTAENGGNWCVIAGTVEPGEAPLEAARREMLEETGIQPCGDLSGESTAPDGTQTFIFTVAQESDVDLSRVDPTALEGDVAAGVAWWTVSDALAAGVELPEKL
jgi:ADP-ribose pyrophosphatase YjhB (NUDIX family)